MPRPKNIDPPVTMRINLPTSVIAKMRLELYSELEGRVPHGAISTLLARLVREWLEKERGISV